MLRFFRQIRQRLLTDNPPAGSRRANRFSKYLLYAVGEIFLVVVGILIALQVNNWNEQRIQLNRYEFGIEKIHKRLFASSLYWETYQDRAQYQIAVIDSLLDIPDSIPPNRMVGNLLVLDELIRDWYVDAHLYLDYLNFFPTDSVQFDIYESLNRYFNGAYQDLEAYYKLKEEESFMHLLKNQNMPICDLIPGQSFKNFIRECSNTKVSTEQISDLKELISTKEFRARLQLQKTRCRNLMVTESTPESPVLETIEDSFDFLNRHFYSMEIVGSGTLPGSWDNGIKITPSNKEYSIWQDTVTLKDGEIKFRVDKNWNFNWGIGEMDQDKLVFGGPNIPVKAGTFLVTINLDKKNYELKLIP
ncbi:cadherin repeat domain-containing protein [Eudoraea adriatica]|uniref:hypothetical protein n=1 Tax=Eudoraea adriatica TaxID=446681 RepID=UPI0003805B62|nr:hypothetical protein [Eudoraea adriatica]